jgi:phage terminase large subunit
VGGLDFGFRNPFAAIWGVLDRDDILWITGEYYQHERPLSHHVGKIPRNVEWYADPSEAGDIAELKVANYTVLPGRNAIRPGIAAVSARLQEETLRVVHGACPNLLREAEFYRYGTDPGTRRSEKPQDNDDHALDALRYLIASIDVRKLGRRPKISGAAAGEKEPARKPWLRLDNEALWRRIW